MDKFKAFHAIIFFLVLMSAISCRQAEKGKEILTTKIQYDVPIVSSNPQLDWWINNIEGSRRDPFLKRIMEAAEKGQVRLYDYFNNPMTPLQLQQQCIDTVYQTLLRNYPPYEEYDTMIIIPVELRDITKIRFLEEWTWDPATVKIEKKVIGLGPVIQRQVAGETFSQLLFWIYFDEDFIED
jgi:hypothetical protein